jgi:hypothetical protein
MDSYDTDRSVLHRQTPQPGGAAALETSRRSVGLMYSSADARNDRILVWWLPDYDEALRQLVDEYQWVWPSMARVKLEAAIPAGVLSAWRDNDPLCTQRSWSAVLAEFAAARAEQLGILPRQPRQVACSCCSEEFLESHVPIRPYSGLA